MRILFAFLFAVLLVAGCQTTPPPLSGTPATYTNRYCDVAWTPLVEEKDHFYFEGIRVTPHPSVQIEYVRVVFEDAAGNRRAEAYGRPEPSDSFVQLGQLRVEKCPGLTGVALVKTSGASEPIRLQLR